MPISTKFYSLFSSVFFLFAGFALFLNSAGIKLAEMGVNETLIGILNATFFIGAASSALAAHRIVASVGHIRSFSVFGAIFAVAALGHLMIENLLVWGILRVVMGFCYYSLLMIVESWFSEKTTSENRSKVLANYNIVFYLSFSLGIAFLSFSPSSHSIFTFSAMLVVMAMVPVALTRIKEPELPPRDRISMPRIFMIAPLALMTSFIGGMLVNGFYTMSSVFMLKQGFSVQQFSLYLMLAMLGGFLTQFPIAKLSNRYGRRNTILICALFALLSAVLGLFLLYHPTSYYWLHYMVAFLMGCGLFTLYALSIAQANDVLPNEMSTVELSRSLLFAYGMGALIAPPFLGFIMNYFVTYGFYSIYVVASCLLIIYALKQKSVPKEERSVYVAMPTATTTVVSEIDPRNDEENSEPFNEQVAQEYQEYVENLEESTDQDEEIDNNLSIDEVISSVNKDNSEKKSS